MSNSNNTKSVHSWDTYWQGAQASAAYTSGGTSHPLVLSFWSDYFADVQNHDGDPKFIDIASGNGGVVECANTAYGGQLPDFTCLDVSASAIRMLEERFPGVSGIVADAAAIPLDSASYDIATSQFGIEYAGLDALGEVTRLIAPGGELALLLHHRGGIIYTQCAASFSAVSEMRAAQFIPKCIAMFEAGFAVVEGGHRARYGAAGKKFAPAIQEMEAIMARHGTQVADGTITRLYRDVRDIHARMRHYEPSEVLGWLERMQDEMEAYSGRMASMRDVAIDATKFKQVHADLADNGFEILRAEPLAPADQSPPIAWALIAKKR